MKYNEWRERWEQEAAAERSGHKKHSTDALLEKVRKGWFGEYYSLWYVIGDQGTLEDFGWPLMAVLRGKASYLHRYHCARALLKLLGEKELEPVHLSGNIPGVEQNLDRIEAQLAERIGPRPEPTP